MKTDYYRGAMVAFRVLSIGIVLGGMLTGDRDAVVCGGLLTLITLV